jgi:hypothetical protein
MHNKEYATKPIYAVIVTRIGEFTQTMSSSVLFYKDKTATDEYVKELLADPSLSFVRPAVTVIECDLSAYDVDAAFILPKQYSVLPQTKEPTNFTSTIITTK